MQILRPTGPERPTALKDLWVIHVHINVWEALPMDHSHQQATKHVLDFLLQGCPSSSVPCEMTMPFIQLLRLNETVFPHNFLTYLTFSSSANRII